MDEYIVDQEISNAIEQYADTNPKPVVKSIGGAKVTQQQAWNGKQQKEAVVLFEEPLFPDMVVLVQ